MIFRQREAHVKHLDPYACARREAGETSPAFQLHIHIDLRIESYAHPKVLGRDKIHADDKMLRQRLNERIPVIIFIRIIDIIELPTVQVLGRQRKTNRGMRHFLRDTHLDIPRHLLSLILVSFQLRADILQGETKRKTLIRIIITQSRIHA